MIRRKVASGRHGELDAALGPVAGRGQRDAPRPFGTELWRQGGEVDCVRLGEVFDFDAGTQAIGVAGLQMSGADRHVLRHLHDVGLQTCSRAACSRRPVP